MSMPESAQTHSLDTASESAPSAARSLQRSADEEEEEFLQAKSATPSGPDATEVGTPACVHRTLNSPGQPLSRETRRFFEPRFGHDFSQVRVHTDAEAAQSTHAVKAQAYTVGRHIAFAPGGYAPDTASGRRLLAHELTHVLQQGGGRVTRASVSKASTARAEERVMRLSVDRFKRRIGGRNPRQRLVIERLFSHPTFLKLWNWLDRCPNDRKDHGPIKLRVGRTFNEGAQTFAKFTSGEGEGRIRGILKVNPKKAESKENELELADSLIHELAHAISWAKRNGKCPLLDEPIEGVTTFRKITDDERNIFQREFPGAERNLRLDEDTEIARYGQLGPGASHPCRTFLDITPSVQNEIVAITRDIHRETGIGGPTLTQVNQILRDEFQRAQPIISRDALPSQAPLLARFLDCRDAECAKRPRKQNLKRCFDDVLQAHASQADATRPNPESPALQRTPDPAPEASLSTDQPGSTSLQGATKATAAHDITQQNRGLFGARFRRLRAGCLEGERPAVSTAIGRNDATVATGLLRVRFNGLGRTKFDPDDPSSETLLPQGEKRRAANRKHCFCDCMIYRQYIAAKAWSGVTGGIADTEADVVGSGLTQVPADGKLHEENTSGNVWCNSARQRGCERCFVDRPGVPEDAKIPLREGKPVELRYNFVLQIWDACRRKEMWRDQRSLTITGNRNPRSILWSTMHGSLAPASVKGAVSAPNDGSET